MKKMRQNLLRLKLPGAISDFFAASLILCILYRIFFFSAIFPATLESVWRQLLNQSLGLMSDFIACSWVSAFLFGLYYLLILITPKIAKPIVNTIFAMFVFIIFVIVAGLYLCNLRTFVSVYIGINYTLVKTYLSQSNLSNISAFMTNADIIMFSLMMITYGWIKFISVKVKQKLTFFLILLYFILSFYSLITFINASIIIAGTRFIALYTSPVNHVLTTYLESFNKYNYYQIQINDQQLQSLKLIDSAFLQNLPKEAVPLLQTNTNRKNVVIFVLESVGYNALVDRVSGKNYMPFLHHLANLGVWFENNYSGGNISSLGQFSIFTGLYPNPNHSHFEMRRDLNIPSLADWVDKSYHSFLVSASNDLYFAISINKAFGKYFNASQVDPDNKNLFFSIFSDENKSFKFFLNQLNDAHSPFIAAYWSGAAHFPYKNYAKSTNTVTSSLERYRNNLALLDQEIQQVYASLKKRNLLNQTVFIVVGDHGDSFGEHSNTYVHGFSLYQPEIKVPLLIYAPSQLKPKQIKTVTSSVDILPTLLDIMHIPYQNNLQGESILSPISSNKYVFVYGDLDEIAAIDKHNIKMIISFAKNACASFNLNTDPDELHPLSCTNQAQLEAILKFRNFQPEILNHFSNRSKDQAY